MTRILVKYADLKIVKATNMAVFELPVPAGIQKISLD
ncbi:MAG: hypothetical protein H6Q49_1732 [Deltaproteobacteria bacterium]|nr:hypothetical protein [Deltaproteobacteria bacterium]